MATDDSVARVGMKMPEFTVSKPSAWFVIMEAQFKISAINQSSTKFYHAISGLPPNIVARLSDEVLTSEDYETLKNGILEYYEKSKPELFDELIYSKAMTGRPSNYLIELREIGKKLGIPDDLIRQRFLSAAPKSLAPVLAAQSSLPLADLGKLADSVQPFLREADTPVNAVSKESSGGKPWQTNAKRNYGLTPFSPNQRAQVCRSHIFFAGNARTCRHWCQWPNKSSSLQIQDSRPNSRDSSPNRSEN